ncbi:MAG: quinone-dependent dihydroorotate dehydrogenase [Flavobacteriales bacterium]|nr:quinone-dependent dihydroorotate dehydrogenase [Flavobacteriales bacterium]
MYSVLRYFLFKIQPEKAHQLTFSLIKFITYIPGVKPLLHALYNPTRPGDQVVLFGLTFPNRVGLAAGFDKDAKLFDELACFGFGFIEIGTVTPRAQSGNPKPRLFRLIKDHAIINRMGFNNEGVEAAAYRLRHRKNRSIIIGGNIGKNKLTPNEEATSDYIKAFEALYPFVDYFVVNVSSPNTPGLRELQEKEPLKKLLQTLQQHNENKPFRKPLLLKIAPDLTQNQLDDIIDIAFSCKLDGIIATNTTISREGLLTPVNELQAIGPGGLSGKPLTQRSTEVIRYLVKKSEGKIPVIGVGGIMNGNDALDKIKAGASLVQVYTGFIYRGPELIREIVETIRNYKK